MDVTRSRKDFRRATICVPPSALRSSSPKDSTSTPPSYSTLYTSPLKHRYSPWGQIFPDENDGHQNQSMNHIKLAHSTHSTHSSHDHDHHLSHNDNNNANGDDDGHLLSSSLSSSDSAHVHDHDSFFNRNSLDRRRMSTGSCNHYHWESSFRSPPFAPSSLPLKGEKNDTGGPSSFVGHRSQSLYEPSSSSPSEPSPLQDLHPKFNPSSGHPLFSDPTPPVRRSSIFSSLSTALFGSRTEPQGQGTRDDSLIGMRSKRPTLPSYWIGRDDDHQNRPGFHSSVPLSPSAPQPNEREKKGGSSTLNGSLGPSTSPRPISPMGTLLLRTEF